MKISVADFRCFHEATDIDVRPINILVGENSAGKSSYLAAVRFLLDLLKDDTKASFNKDPFYLGSYDQIAHFRGGRFGRAKEFAFNFSENIDPNLLKRRAALLNRQATALASSFSTEIKFVNDRSQPAISHVQFRLGGFGIDLQLRDTPRAVVHTPKRRIELPVGRALRINDPLVYDLSAIEYLLRDLRLSQRKGDFSEEDVDDVFFVYDLYEMSKRALPRDVYASAPVRSKPARTYNPGESNPAPDGEHIPFVLSQIKEFDEVLWAEVAAGLREFGQASGLFDDISVRRLSKTESGPFQLIVNSGGFSSNIIDVGYGVSQSLPIITDLTRAKSRSVFLIQQPEVHLHPKAQAALATFLAKIVKNKRHTVFIETHSDYLINRLRMNVRDGENIEPDDLSILYFERADLDVTIHSITVDDNGNIRGAPSGYRKFFIEEEMRSLGIAE
ncbi:AAA family ATPase [Bradyrhizobium aeschynomenes]|uniref:AAA family ATPase n=1 Tax=Bradyrhizobium aeschynomenes TaxID=2734909 RepID=UPI001555BEFC|nr:DUF3696 domain-containing protein [Bradyrhizobium aeschynomenes]NPV22382.1 DUF3696 domain-containing protein [Bradyrhizobium aeschynomenes]